MFNINRYFELLSQYPHLFINDESPLSIRIITDVEIIKEQQKLFYKAAKRRGVPNYWYDLGVLAEDEWIIVLRDLIQKDDHQYGRYIRVVNKTSVVERTGNDIVIMPIQDNKILILDHYRHELRCWNYELPRGFAEPAQTPFQNARRELYEETKLEADFIQPIGGILKDGSFNRTVYFHANVHGNVVIERSEAIRGFRWVSVEELEALITEGIIYDSYTLNAYTYARISGILK